jgi:hypothetical protein
MVCGKERVAAATAGARESARICAGKCGSRVVMA